MKGTMQSTSSTITLTLDEGDEDEQLMTDDDTPAIPVPKTVIMPKSVVSKEVHLLDPSVEQQGAKDVLAALTPDERDAIPDPNMPLRHFRAEKVCSCEHSIGDEATRKPIVPAVFIWFA